MAGCDILLHHCFPFSCAKGVVKIFFTLHSNWLKNSFVNMINLHICLFLVTACFVSPISFPSKIRGLCKQPENAAGLSARQAKASVTVHGHAHESNRFQIPVESKSSNAILVVRLQSPFVNSFCFFKHFHTFKYYET